MQVGPSIQDNDQGGVLSLARALLHILILKVKLRKSLEYLLRELSGGNPYLRYFPRTLHQRV